MTPLFKQGYDVTSDKCFISLDFFMESCKTAVQLGGLNHKLIEGEVNEV